MSETWDICTITIELGLSQSFVSYQLNADVSVTYIDGRVNTFKKDSAIFEFLGKDISEEQISEKANDTFVELISRIARYMKKDFDKTENVW